MLITRLSYSAINTFDWCQHKYFMEYNLGMRSPPNKKALIGNIVHKVFEGLALANKAKKEQQEVIKDEVFGELSLEYCEPDYLLNAAFHDYSKKHPSMGWHEGDLETCDSSVNKVLNFQGGIYDPRKVDVFDAEHAFDIPIEEDWAKYSWEIDGQTVEGQFSIKGVIDLVIQHDDTYEIVDWKTGKRLDWNTGQVKDFRKLTNDLQLRMYHYAASKLFPGKVAYPTIFFITDGGPFTIPFDDRDLKITHQILKDYFLKIASTTRPTLNVSWKCNKLCPFSKLFVDENGLPNGKTVCETIKSSIEQNGIWATYSKFKK